MEAREIGAVPFADKVEREALAGEAVGEKRSFDPVGRDDRGQCGGEEKAAPGQERAPTRPRIGGIGERFDRIEADQAEADDEAGVEIGPERQQRQDEKGRRPSRRPRALERDHPRDQDRHGQDMGARDQMRRGQKKTRCKPDQDGRVWQDRCQELGEQIIGGRDRRCGHGDDANPAERSISAGEDQLGKPFMRDPGSTPQGEGEWIARRNLRVCPDPVSGGDMKEGVAVVKQVATRPQHQRIGEDRDEKRRRPFDAPVILRDGRGDFVARGGPREAQIGESHRGSPEGRKGGTESRARGAKAKGVVARVQARLDRIVPQDGYRKVKPSAPIGRRPGARSGGQPGVAAPGSAVLPAVWPRLWEASHWRRRASAMS